MADRLPRFLLTVLFISTALSSSGCDVFDPSLLDGAVDAAATFTLEGQATGTELSTDGIAQALEDGIWTGMWGDSGMSDEINGSFTGRRRL